MSCGVLVFVTELNMHLAQELEKLGLEELQTQLLLQGSQMTLAMCMSYSHAWCPAPPSEHKGAWLLLHGCLPNFGQSLILIWNDTRKV